MTDAPVTYSLDGNVAVIHFDDGKANVFTHAALEELQSLLTRAEADEAKAVVIVGRPGKFSAGFDLSVMTAGPDQARDLLRAGADLALRIYTFPMPVLLAVTGHALAMGAIVLMAADVRIGADGPSKIGLPEVEIGMPLPKFAVEFARDRLSKHHFVSAVQHARVTTPADAVDVGFLDRVVDPEPGRVRDPGRGARPRRSSPLPRLRADPREHPCRHRPRHPGRPRPGHGRLRDRSAVSDPVIDCLDTVWRSIIDLGDQLSEAEWKLPTDLPGWSVQDNVSHIIGTERNMRGEPTPEVTPPRSDHVHNPTGEMNEHWVESRRSLSGAAVLDEFRTVTAERLSYYRSLTPAELDAIGPTPLGDAPFREFIAVRVMDSWTHEQDMRRAVGQPGHLEGPAVALSIGRVTRAMPMVVGRRAGAPDGSSVVFVLTGAEGGVVPVVVDGRAAVATNAPDDPTVELHLDVETYAALGMGRLDPAEALSHGRVSVVGDHELGHAVVSSMSFMI